MSKDKQEVQSNPKVTYLDGVLAVPMFVVSSLFLLGTGAFLHLIEGDVTSPLAVRLLIFLGVLYLFFIAETIAHFYVKSNSLRQHIWYLLMPILRFCPRDHVDGSRVWIAGLGWRETTPRLQQYLARLFSGPMIVIALLILPVVALEFLYADYIAASQFRRFVISTSSGFIWMAFVYEFVVMVSIVEKRVRYCRANWIDVAVVLLPLVSFMGAARLGRLVKLKQLSRTAKIYRMRGMAIRSWRAIVALDVIDTILRKTPEDKMERLTRQIKEKEEEISDLKIQLERLEASQAKSVAQLASKKTESSCNRTELNNKQVTDDVPEGRNLTNTEGQHSAMIGA